MIKSTELFTKLLVWIGGALIFGAVFITVGDVIARALFSVGYIGLVDVTQFAVIGFAYLSMPFTFLKRGHIAIELYDHKLGVRSDALLKTLAGVLCCGVLAILIYYGWTQANRTLRYGDVSQNIEIPMIIFWVLVLSGAFISLLICAAQVVQSVLTMFKSGQENA